MRKILSYFVLVIIATVGLASIYQMNSVTGLLKVANAEMLNSDWSEPYYDDGAVEPSPSDFGEPTMD